MALANGVVLTPRAPGSKRKRFGLRPKLYDTWIAPLWVGCATATTTKEESDATDIKEKQDTSAWAGSSQGRWCDMLPVTVQTVIVKRRAKPEPTGYDGNPTNAAASPAFSTTTQLTASPPSLFPNSPPTGTSSGIRPLIPHIVPPSNFVVSSSPVEVSPYTPTERRRSLRPLSVQFADQARPGLFSFPHSHSTSFDNEATRRRSRRNSALSILTPSPSLENHLGGGSNGESRRQRRNSTGSSLGQPIPTHSRERSDSTTWRQIISPNPSLPAPPVPPVPTPSTPSGGNERTVNWEPNPPSPRVDGNGNDRRLGLRARLLPNVFSRRNQALPDSDDMQISASPSTATGGRLPPRSQSKYRIRTEMLQISVLVAMPSLKTSRLYGDANVVKSSYGSYRQLHNPDGDVGKKKRKRVKETRARTDESGDVDEIVEIPGEDGSDLSDEESDIESEEEKEDDEPQPLPELVLGVTRLNYRPSQSVHLATVNAEKEKVEEEDAEGMTPSTPPTPSISVAASPASQQRPAPMNRTLAFLPGAMV
ncbi:hypothetical protein CC1G_03030 [Coprinopsis cinerea okayama7|uniref:Uncharacterized protein n=1 Tax=Coprinopsis cinerea (strain Okayama-7 / 130 / ATCC MYA-4618 / FGSC 9003) TaxID=240176 RepID=A8NS55_COPC7|nr:hypothetical protein CC1G_03030 [Coprinopsis cinerea okayama7\|eukprot:XP_001835942.1 hypothetical protein CC1G_03030 [Coprinopsis cinerea okayama7\